MEAEARYPRIHFRSYIIIPARAASSRLPQKLLLNETGKPLLQHTYEAALQASKPVGVCVAAADEAIAAAVRLFNGEAQLTDPSAATGTDRVAEAARRLPADIDIIVNVQGDEPEICPASIDQVIELLEQDPQTVMSTLATPIRSRKLLDDPNCVKVVFNEQGRALYFSRSPIPHPRNWDDELLSAEPPLFYQHVGLYAYRREFLDSLAALPQSGCEQVESLEQLRVLSAGYAIRVGVVSEAPVGVDTADDYRAFVRRTGNC